MEGVKKTYWDAIKDLEPLKTVRPPKPAAEAPKPAAEKPAEPSKTEAPAQAAPVTEVSA